MRGCRFCARELYNVLQISDRVLSQKKTITLQRNGKDNTKKVSPPPPEFKATNLRSFLFDWFAAREFFGPKNKTDILDLGVKYFFDLNGPISS